MLKLLNKKAFTLIELIIVVLLLGVILAFALPNITSTLERNKKDQFIIDAKDFIEKAKNQMLKTGDYPVSGSCKAHSLKDVDIKKEIKDSPYGSEYDRENSQVQICIDSSIYKYKVKLVDSKGNGIQNLIDFSYLDKDGKYSLIEIN